METAESEKTLLVAGDGRSAEMINLNERSLLDVKKCRVLVLSLTLFVYALPVFVSSSYFISNWNFWKRYEKANCALSDHEEIKRSTDQLICAASLILSLASCISMAVYKRAHFGARSDTQLYMFARYVPALLFVTGAVLTIGSTAQLSENICGHLPRYDDDGERNSADDKHHCIVLYFGCQLVAHYLPFILAIDIVWSFADKIELRLFFNSFLLFVMAVLWSVGYEDRMEEQLQDEGLIIMADIGWYMVAAISGLIAVAMPILLICNKANAGFATINNLLHRFLAFLLILGLGLGFSDVISNYQPFVMFGTQSFIIFVLVFEIAYDLQFV